MHHNKKTHKYRYPGITPFSTEQKHIFFGRNHEKAELTRLIKRNNLVVLFSKSGLGKSSLLNAGIVPIFRNEEKYEPTVIRFGAWTPQKKEGLIDICKKAFQKKEQGKTYLSSLLPEDHSLWHHAKNCQLKMGKRPMLIFDQFEELFYYPEDQIAVFMQELTELIRTNIPLRFRRHLDAGDHHRLTEAEEDNIDSPLKTRIVIAIRSDRVHLLSRLSTYLPNLLKFSYELKALTKEDAHDAIQMPAKVEGDFLTNPFEYTPEAIDQFLNFLQDKEDGRIEGILLQMICEYYERQLVYPNDLRLIRSSDIGNLHQVIRDYYKEKIEGIEIASRTAASRLIEEGLVSEGEHMRLTLHEAYILENFEVGKDLLEELVDSRLLRSEPFMRGGYTYELSHDRLIPAVLEARQLRRKEEARSEAERLRVESVKTKKQLRRFRHLFIVATLLFISSLTLMYFVSVSNHEAQENKQVAIKALDNLIIRDFKNFQDRIDLILEGNGCPQIIIPEMKLSIEEHTQKDSLLGEIKKIEKKIQNCR